MAQDKPVDQAQPHIVSRPDTYRPLRLTGRGTILLIVVVCFVTSLAALMFGQPTVSGVGFLCAVIFAVLFVRPQDLLTLSVSPPIAYFVGALLAELAYAFGRDGQAGGALVGIGAQLAHAAPWLFLGTAIVLVLGVFRGLATSIREFTEELTAARIRRGSRSESHGKTNDSAAPTS